MSFVSINQPYRKAMINNKYNYQDNHQSSVLDAVDNILKPSSWSSPDNLFSESFQISGRGQTFRKSFKDFLLQ